MNPILYAVPVFLFTVLLEAWIAHRRGRALYDLADAITSLQHGVLSQVAGFFLRFGIYAAVYENYRAMSLPTDQLWVWIVALLAYDFFYYWTHRMGHEVNVFWAAHVVHHSSEHYNLSTALRQTSTGNFLSWIFYLPMAVAGVPPLVFVVVGLIDLLYQYWVHTQLIGRLGWLDRVFVTPSNHRVHHGQNDYCIDKNYGGILILWDRLFGSFAEERDDEVIVYGIRKPLSSFNPLWGNLHYYVDIWRSMRAAQGWRAKLAVWFAPPGGWDVPLAHFEATNFTRHTSTAPPLMGWYVAFQYAFGTPFVAHFIAVAPSLSLVAAGAYALGILITTVTLGRLLDSAAHAVQMEQLRLLMFGAAFMLLPEWFGFDAPNWLRACVVLTTISAAAWLYRQMALMREVRV